MAHQASAPRNRDLKSTGILPASRQLHGHFSPNFEISVFPKAGIRLFLTIGKTLRLASTYRVRQPPPVLRQWTAGLAWPDASSDSRTPGCTSPQRKPDRHL